MSNTPDIDKAYDMLKESTPTRLLLEEYESQLQVKDARIKELETMTEGYRYRGVENKLWKRIESLTNKLEVLTKCVQWIDEEGDCIGWFPDKADFCQGCKNKQTLEGVKGE